MKDYSQVDYKLLILLRFFAKKIAKRFKLSYKRIDLFDLNDPDRLNCDGICYSDGYIYIKTRYRKRSKLYTLESLIDTIIHELSHLQHGPHNKEFWARHKKMKSWFYKNIY